jgi:hypothetical protein
MVVVKPFGRLFLSPMHIDERLELQCRAEVTGPNPEREPDMERTIRREEGCLVAFREASGRRMQA